MFLDCFDFRHHLLLNKSNREILINLIRRTKEAVKEFDNIRYRRMKKVLMGHEEQSTINTTIINQMN